MTLAAEIRMYDTTDANTIASNLSNAVDAAIRYRRALRTHDTVLANAIRRAAHTHNWNLEE